MSINEAAWAGGFRRVVGDESLGATLALVLDSATKQLHICDAADSGTDWGLSADSYPSVYIHDIAAPITDYIKIYHNGTNGIIDCDGTTILSMTASSLDITGTLGITGDVTVTGGVTWTAAIDVTLTAPTTADNAIYGLITASAAWTAGNMTAVRGLVTLSGSNNYVSATGGWFGLNFATKTGSGSGLTCAINAEVTSNNAVVPNAIVYLQSLPNGSTADFSNVPFIAFTEYAASGTGSNILFSLGHQPAGANRNVTTGTSGNIIYQQTLHIIANGSDAYIPYSTVAGAYTTAYLIQSSLATDAESSVTGAVIIAGGVGIAKKLYVGTNLDVTGTSALDGNVTLSANLYMPSGGIIDFNSAGITITHSPTNGDRLAVATTWTTVGATGRPFYVVLATDVKLGSYANAFKAQVEAGTNGGSSGLLSVGNFEMLFPKSGEGNFACVEMEATTPADTFTGLQNQTTFMYCNATGSTVEALLDTISFVQFESGLVAATGNMIAAGYSTIRVSFDLNMTTKRYIPLSTVEESYTSAYPVALTYGGTALDVTSTVAAADEMAYFYCTNSSTAASGDHSTVRILTDQTGAKTGGTTAIIGLNIETVIQANCPDVHALSMWTGFYSDPTMTEYSSMWIFTETLGASEDCKYHMLDLNVETDVRTTHDCMAFISCYAHTGSSGTKQILWLEGGEVADYLFEHSTIGAPCEENASDSSTRTHRVKVKIAGTEGYLSVFSS